MAEKLNNESEKGFTLVELLVSVVIISIIFFGVFQLFTFSAKTATSNETKLVTTHLAKATIERIKVDYESFFPPEEIKCSENEKFIYSKQNCAQTGSINCDRYEFIVNDILYDVEVKVSQNNDEQNLNLLNVVVTVEQPDKNINSKVEGYVIYEPPTEQ